MTLPRVLRAPRPRLERRSCGGPTVLDAIGLIRAGLRAADLSIAAARCLFYGTVSTAQQSYPCSCVLSTLVGHEAHHTDWHNPRRAGCWIAPGELFDAVFLKSTHSSIASE